MSAVRSSASISARISFICSDNSDTLVDVDGMTVMLRPPTAYPVAAFLLRRAEGKHAPPLRSPSCEQRNEGAFPGDNLKALAAGSARISTNIFDRIVMLLPYPIRLSKTTPVRC